MDATTARRSIAARPELCAFIGVSEEEGPGPAVAVKDLIDVAGMVTTGGGAILPATPATADADCVSRLRQAGGVVVGKTNLHEWALGPTSDNPHYGAVRNPLDIERVPGGSSGGSAAAVAAGLCDWAIGTDTGGSIRMPAALCGVAGMKPTPGLISTRGVIPLARSLDVVGPIAPDVGTLAEALGMLCADGHSVSDPVAALAQAPADAASFRLATPRGWVTGLDDDVGRVWQGLAAGLVEVDFPAREALAATFNSICGYEAGRFHEDWVRRFPERYGADVLARLRDGLMISAEEYDRALAEREVLRAEALAAMDGCDALMLPATACVAPRLTDRDRREPLTRFLRGFSVTGQPVVVLPAPSAGLPVGIQLVGRPGEDAALLRIARAVERSWASRPTLEGRA